MTHDERLVLLYGTAQQRLERLVRQALERGALGTAGYRQRQLAHVRLALADLAAKTPAEADLAATGAYRAAALAVDEVLGRQGTVAFGGVHRQAVEVLVANLDDRLAGAIAEVGRRTRDAFRTAALKETAIGIATGASRREVSAALTRRLVEESVADSMTGFVDARGRRWDLADYARMVARTTTAEAQSAATANRLVEQGGDLVAFAPNPSACDLCKRYQGNVYSLTGHTPGYPVLKVLPPFHPNCEDTVTPAEVDFDAWLAALRAAA